MFNWNKRKSQNIKIQDVKNINDNRIRKSTRQRKTSEKFKNYAYMTYKEAVTGTDKIE